MFVFWCIGRNEAFRSQITSLNLNAIKRSQQDDYKANQIIYTQRYPNNGIAALPELLQHVCMRRPKQEVVHENCMKTVLPFLLDVEVENEEACSSENTKEDAKESDVRPPKAL